MTYDRFPLCFSSREQYQAWKLLAINTVGVLSGICTDCTPKYQKEMIEADRCTHPDVKFGFDEDGLVTGFAPNVKRPNQKIIPKQKIVDAINAAPLNAMSNWFPEFKDVRPFKKRNRHE
jgi:hypothetical protein